MRTTIAAIGAAAVLAGTGLGVASAQKEGSSSSGQAPAAQGMPGGGGPSAANVTALAKDLGVSTAKLKKAMQASRPSGTPGQRGAGAPGDMAAKLAKQLGLSEAKVKKALEANKPSGAPPSGGQPPAAGGQLRRAPPADHSSSPARSQESLRRAGDTHRVTDAIHRVLVVDDEPNIVDVITMALRFQGFEVESAGTGAGALAAVSRFKPAPDAAGRDAARHGGLRRGPAPGRPARALCRSSS